MTSNEASGQFSQHSVHLVQVEKLTTGRMRARRVLLEQLVASRPEAADFSSDWIGIRAALWLTLDRNAATHVFPAGQVELEQLFGIALAGFYIAWW